LPAATSSSYTFLGVMAPRLFTLDEANALLPRLSQLVPQIQESKSKHDRLQEKAAEYAHLMSSNGRIIEKELNETRQELAQAATELKRLIERVQEMDCELKDIEQGLVDFRWEREGREVYLCWKLGEPDIRWWHEMDTGFAGRRPLE
jgi:hypothetical protein